MGNSDYSSGQSGVSASCGPYPGRGAGAPAVLTSLARDSASKRGGRPSHLNISAPPSSVPPSPSGKNAVKREKPTGYSDSCAAAPDPRPPPSLNMGFSSIRVHSFFLCGFSSAFLAVARVVRHRPAMSEPPEGPQLSCLNGLFPPANAGTARVTRQSS